MITELMKEKAFCKQLELYDKGMALIKRNGAVLSIETDYKAVYGMGEKFDSLNQRGNTVENQVIEKFCNQGKFSYIVTPFFVTDQGMGIYVDTKEKTTFCFQDVITCEIPGEASVYIFNGKISEVISAYMKLSGKAVMPPEYAFGIWISANRWNSQKDVEIQLSYLKQYHFPASVIVLEAWSDEATFYIWNGAQYSPKPPQEKTSLEQFDFSQSSYFPDPVKMIHDIHDQGMKLVLWQIPVFKMQAEDETVCEQLVMDKNYAIKNHLCVENADGTPYEIPVGNWFEGSTIPDFSNPKTKEFWFNKRQYLSDMGVDGFKTDGGEFIYKKDVNFFDKTTGIQGKNQYCQNYLDAYTEFINQDQVLFSRAGYTGAHTTPIHWAGDHQSTNQELKAALAAGLSAAMSGIIFWSFDIGGFAGPLPSMDLYKRSTQLACFCPIMQWHSEPDGGQFKELMPGAEGNNERSPWNMASCYNRPEFMDEIRYWHELRMNMMPYIIHSAKEASDHYQPMMRPLIYSYQEDSQAYLIEDEYLFGENMLVAPLLEENQTVRSVYFPRENWYGFFTGKKYTGKGYQESDTEEKMPVYIKEGSAIPMKEGSRIKIRLYGIQGRQQIYLNQQYIDIEWKLDQVNVKGVIKEEAEWCFIH